MPHVITRRLHWKYSSIAQWKRRWLSGHAVKVYNLLWYALCAARYATCRIHIETNRV